MRLTALVIVLCIFVVVSLYLWLGNAWVCVSAASFLGLLLLLAVEILGNGWSQSNQRHEDHQNLMEALDGLRREVVDQEQTLREIVGRLDSLNAMAEFAGEQAFSNFASTVLNFKRTQEEELRKKTQSEAEERRFEETLNAGVRDARIKREKEASAAREALRRSHQTDKTEKP